MSRNMTKQIKKNKEKRNKNRIGVGMMAATIALTGMAMPAMDAVGITSPMQVEASQVHGDFTYTVNADNTVAITGIQKPATHVEIPSEIDGKTVTKINKEAFAWLKSVWGNTKIQSLTLPDTITRIDGSAFRSQGIKELTIPSSVQFIGSDAFANMGLTNLTLEEGVGYIDMYAFRNNSISNVMIPASAEYMSSAFSNNTVPMTVAFAEGTKKIHPFSLVGSNVVEVNIPNTVTEIGAGAFNGTPLKSVTLPKGLESIGERAFRNTNVTELVIPSSVTSIGANAFTGVKLKELTIPSSVTSIGKHVISETNLDSLVIEEGITSIDAFAFADAGIKNVKLPDSLTSIGESAFLNSNLEQLDLPKGLKTIGDNAFNGGNLTSVLIPKSVTHVGVSAFANNNIDEVTVEGDTTRLGADVFAGNQSTPNNIVFYAPANSMAKAYAEQEGFFYVEHESEPEVPVEPIEPDSPNNSDKPSKPAEPKNSTPNEDGTAQENNVMANLVGGGLLLGNVSIYDFGDIPIGLDRETHYTSIANPISVKDLRGTKEGWDLSVSATPFESADHTLPTGSFTLDGVADITSERSSEENMPTKKLTERTIIDDGSVLIAKADVGKGSGEFDIEFDKDALGLTVDPETAEVGAYTSTVTWTLASTPTSGNE